jgi:hypothetical protein
VKIKSQRDFAAGLMFIVVGIAFAIGATNYTYGESARPGPGYFPLLLGVIMTILGAVVLFKALTVESDGGDPIGDIAWKPLLLIVGAVALFGLLLPRLGMVITIPALVILSSMAGDEFHWRDALINSIALTIFSYLVFVLGLSLTIPLWPTMFGAGT